MSINSKLKKEGIEIIEKLDTLKVNTIATSISSKLCLAFPEHNLNRSELFSLLSRLEMYVATMPFDASGAKYYYKNNSIYLNNNLSIDDMAYLSVHECIHYLQYLNKLNNNSPKMGLYNVSLNNGLGINEAAVQLMSSEANMCKNVSETYFGVTLKTNSPDYYPLECSLVNQMAYFTGTYPLYHSTLNSNDIFKKTFILKSNKYVYSAVVKNLDKLISLENDLAYFSSELQYADKMNVIKLLNKLIMNKKSQISELYITTQNIIMENCFANEYANIRNLDDIKNFNKRLYKYKNIIGTTPTYSFYNEFYCKMMELIERKKQFIETYGEIPLLQINNNSTSLAVIGNSSFITNILSGIKKLFTANKSSQPNSYWEQN